MVTGYPKASVSLSTMLPFASMCTGCSYLTAFPDHRTGIDPWRVQRGAHDDGQGEDRRDRQGVHRGIKKTKNGK